MLIRSPRHRKDDLERWEYYEKIDGLFVRTAVLKRNIERSVVELKKFVKNHDCYAGVSWGKDSTVLAHLITKHTPKVPLVWIRVFPIYNPDCLLVRDAFIDQYPQITYDEIHIECIIDEKGIHATGTLEKGFSVAIKKYGKNHISGIRADESGPRKARCRHWGISSNTTCAPLAWWNGALIYAYLYANDLPVHPAYACSQGGLWERERIRVASIGGKRGEEFGRTEWENYYYPEVER